MMGSGDFNCLYSRKARKRLKECLKQWKGRDIAGNVEMGIIFECSRSYKRKEKKRGKRKEKKTRVDGNQKCTEARILYA